MLSFFKHEQPEADEKVSGKAGIKIVIASEDADGAVRARELSARLANELKPGMEMTSEIWRFNFLRHEDVRNVASASIADADILVVSARDDGELPGHVQKWIEDWVLSTGSGPRTLLALVDRYAEFPGPTPSLYSYLSRIARRADMEFYLKAGDGLESDFVHVEVEEQEPEADSNAAHDEDDEDAPEASVFESRRFVPETVEARLYKYAHSTAVS